MTAQAEAATDRAVDFHDAITLDGPSSIEAKDSLNGLTELLTPVVAKLTPTELNDIVDMSDVSFEYDHNFMQNWRRMVVATTAGNAFDGEKWALVYAQMGEEL